MIFDQFTSVAASEIEEAFTSFKNANIDELIIDLRYNSGGSLATAAILLDKIAGFRYENQTHTYLRWNQNFSHLDDFYVFEKDNNSLDINRVFFLTTRKTASASGDGYKCTKTLYGCSYDRLKNTWKACWNKW